MENKRSKKHHYLPKKYLRGFTNKEGLLFIYDKQKDCILPKPLPPKSVFFQNNLNTVTLPDGELSDFLENLYTDIENSFWKHLDQIKESTPSKNPSYEDKLYLYLFLLHLYWRLPSNFNYVKEIVNNNKDFSFLSMNYKNNKKEIPIKIKESSSFKKMARLLLPLCPFYKNNWHQKLNNWSLLRTSKENWFYSIGDNPIILRKDKQTSSPFSNEFIFPISSEIILLNKNDSIQKNKVMKNEPEFTVLLGSLIIKRSQRFVANKNKKFLEKIINYYKLHIEFEEVDMTENIFSILGTANQKI